ncbi:cytochrome P450 4B1-like [Platysternon megacephalum]|uniref:Cytochrome P450 4B1-like n=2 Tax=Testudinoidea TaxID=8486 RepID=A0A4D9DX13_9SAUR|nr:cytochrome P450 4B1-like [Platysternon megacephalum]
MASGAANLNAVRETMDVLLEISRILNTGLDMETLSICVRLCEQGINPEALSSVIKELRKATEALKVRQFMKNMQSFFCLIKANQSSNYCTFSFSYEIVPLPCILNKIKIIILGNKSCRLHPVLLIGFGPKHRICR